MGSGQLSKVVSVTNARRKVCQVTDDEMFSHGKRKSDPQKQKAKMSTWERWVCYVSKEFQLGEGSDCHTHGDM